MQGNSDTAGNAMGRAMQYGEGNRVANHGKTGLVPLPGPAANGDPLNSCLVEGGSTSESFFGISWSRTNR